MASFRLSLDRLALGLCLTSVVLGVLIAAIGRMLEHDLVMQGYAVFVTFSIASIVLGVLTRSTPLGKTAAITSSILLIGSVTLLA